MLFSHVWFILSRGSYSSSLLLILYIFMTNYPKRFEALTHLYTFVNFSLTLKHHAQGDHINSSETSRVGAYVRLNMATIYFTCPMSLNELLFAIHLKCLLRFIGELIPRSILDTMHSTEIIMRHDLLCT